VGQRRKCDDGRPARSVPALSFLLSPRDLRLGFSGHCLGRIAASSGQPSSPNVVRVFLRPQRSPSSWERLTRQKQRSGQPGSGDAASILNVRRARCCHSGQTNAEGNQAYLARGAILFRVIQPRRLDRLSLKKAGEPSARPLPTGPKRSRRELAT
jgi:hypothetical protein